MPHDRSQAVAVPVIPTDPVTILPGRTSSNTWVFRGCVDRPDGSAAQIVWFPIDWPAGAPFIGEFGLSSSTGLIPMGILAAMHFHHSGSTS